LQNSNESVEPVAMIAPPFPGEIAEFEKEHSKKLETPEQVVLVEERDAR
jgi:hypothetical protein